MGASEQVQAIEQSQVIEKGQVTEQGQSEVASILQSTVVSNGKPQSHRSTNVPNSTPNSTPNSPRVSNGGRHRSSKEHAVQRRRDVSVESVDNKEWKSTS